MTATCAPLAGTVSGTWHWLKFGDEPVTAFRWDGNFGWWDDDRARSPEQMAADGWRYHSRVAEPDEVEALRMVVRAALDEGSVEIASVMETVGLIDEDEHLTPFGKRALGVEG